MTKFVVAAGANVVASLKLGYMPGFWETGRHSLEVLVFNSQKHLSFQQSLKKGSLCSERSKISNLRRPISEHEEDVRSASFSTTLQWTAGSSSETYYIWLADCALEFYNAEGNPGMDFTLDLRTKELGHLPHDEYGLLTFNILASIALAILLGMNVVHALKELRRTGYVHAFYLVLLAAFALQLAALVCESLHMIVYNFNGKGLRWKYSILPLDFVSELCQGMSEHVITLALIFLSCGWTRVSVVALDGAAATKRGPSARAGDTVMAALAILVRRLAKHPALQRAARKAGRSLAEPFAMFKGGRPVTLGAVFVVWLTAVVSSRTLPSPGIPHTTTHPPINPSIIHRVAWCRWCAPANLGSPVEKCACV